MDRRERKHRVGFHILLPVSVITLLSFNCRLSSYSWADKEERPPQSRPEGSISSVPKTIIDLQPFREEHSIGIKGEQSEEGLASLINLNPNINAWYLLRIKWRKSGIEEAYHFENAHPQTQSFLLDENRPTGLIMVEGAKKECCDLWTTEGHLHLKQAKASGQAYEPLCGGKLYLRNPVKGHRTNIEKVTEVLRDRAPGGEKIIGLVRDTVFRYIYQKKGAEKEGSEPDKRPILKAGNNTPEQALLELTQAGRVANPIHLGIEIEESSRSGVVLGSWYAVKDNPGMYFSLMVPNAIAPEILRSYRNVVSTLDTVESGELVYLLAFDLSQFDLKYALGTEHPRVGWSDHMLSQMKEPSLPGPDGIGRTAPFVSTGLIEPSDQGRAVATFAGGFKREHGAFIYGELARKNHGSHYGFIENGVVFSRLQPGLATLYVLSDGWADMKTWTEKDNSLISEVRYGRQNGVPILTDFDQATHLSIPGPLVSRWGEGNWSGSSDKKLRTIRAGAALQEFSGKRFLIYAFFWNATPSAMARVFQAYRCRYAMLLDMNAFEHTYLAVYKREGSSLYVQHLIKEMSEVDASVKGQYIPRFLGYSDDRDFFYLTRKENP